MSEASRTKDIRDPFDVLSKITDPDKAESLAKNAGLKGQKELEHAARQRAIVLRVAQVSANSPFEADLNVALLAYEAALSQKNGRKQPASRTRPMIPKYGAIEAVAKIVRRGPDAIGFSLLLKLGLAQYTFESLVMKYKELFDSEIVTLAEKSMTEYFDLKIS